MPNNVISNRYMPKTYRTIIRYMCPACSFTVLGNPGEDRACPCGEKMEPVSASVLEACQADWLLRKEQEFADRLVKRAACAGARG